MLHLHIRSMTSTLTRYTEKMALRKQCFVSSLGVALEELASELSFCESDGYLS